MKDSRNYGEGRIGDIIKYLQDEYKVSNPRQLDEKIKLEALCEALQISPDQLDRIIADNSPVLRPIKGHAFETAFEYFLLENNVPIEYVGGDSSIDSRVNGITLQLKTPYEAGTDGNIVSYKTHKTHGAKSETESMEYYHAVDEFADILVGLISYDPLRVLFLRKDELPTHAKDPNRIISPFSIEWTNHPALNNFERIGARDIDVDAFKGLVSPKEHEVLPRTSAELDLASEIILNTILSEPNFRIWDMSIRGFAREIVILDILNEKNIQVFDPPKVRPDRGDKSDIAVKERGTGQYRYLQVKGLSINNCKFEGKASIVGVETQLTRGRVNDHPTQSRLYLRTDFNTLLIAMDPPNVVAYRNEIGESVQLSWEIFAIPTSDLESHHKMAHRLKSLQRIKYIELLSYLIDDEWLNRWDKVEAGGHPDLE